MYHVRLAESKDLPVILEIYANARSFMEKTGNPNQWGKTNPPAEQLIQDISNKRLYVIVDEEIIHGVFYFYIGEDPTYRTIYRGAWQSDEPYGTIHRIAGDESGGILKTALEFCREKIKHIRIDTHRDNVVMQKAIGKCGFTYCGIIYIADGTERLAYEMI